MRQRQETMNSGGGPTSWICAWLGCTRLLRYVVRGPLCPGAPWPLPHRLQERVVAARLRRTSSCRHALDTKLKQTQIKRSFKRQLDPLWWGWSLMRRFSLQRPEGFDRSFGELEDSKIDLWGASKPDLAMTEAIISPQTSSTSV